jgi:transposase
VIKTCYTFLINYEEKSQEMPTTPLLPLPDGLEITAISVAEQELQVRVTSNRLSSRCPLCSTPSSAIHSYYRRKPLELPSTGKTVRLLLSVKKFFCRVACCPRKIFTERLPELLEPSSRLTTRLRSIVQAICAAFNAKGGARLGKQLGIRLSRMTFLRSLHLMLTPPVGKMKAIGIDDFAWKRGKRYGTVIIDLETHRLLDLLPDREAESVKQWLLAHPEIEIISRDRAGAYADGASQGAPQAQQIADRWHVCKNLGDAVEDYLKRQPIQLPAAPSSDTALPEVPVPPVMPVPVAPVKRTRASQAKTARKQAVIDHVKSMHQEGNSIHTIAARLDLARNTVRRYVRIEGPIQPTPRPRKPSQLDPFYDYLCQRFKDGCSNAHQLFAELQEQGYRGGETSVRSFVARLRKGLSGMARPPKHAKHGAAVSAGSPRELRWLLAKREEELTPEERQDLKRLLESSQEVKDLYGLLQSFLQMLRLRQPERLNGWMKEARASGIKELGSFVAGIERDYDAVRAGLTFPWSQGPVEGTVNKIKTHKRLMYGRASFPLLRQKLLHLT